MSQDETQHGIRSDRGHGLRYRLSAFAQLAQGLDTGDSFSPITYSRSPFEVTPPELDRRGRFPSLQILADHVGELQAGTGVLFEWMRVQAEHVLRMTPSRQ